MRSSRMSYVIQSNWPVDLDLEELFFHLRAKGNEVQSKTYVISAKGGASQGDPSYRLQSLLNQGVCGNLVPLGSEIL